MVTLTPELMKELRAMAGFRIPVGLREIAPGRISLRPDTLLALLNRIEELEAKWERPSLWRCDGCGALERPGDGRRPDAHSSCGGYWVRTDNA